jgi:hypothetical protein
MSMNTQIAIPVPTLLFVELIRFLGEQGSNRDPVEVVATSIEYWMQNASWKQGDLMPESFNSNSRGYTWKYKDKKIFLPHGSEIRMPYKGQNHYAKVEGDNILYMDRIISPGALANAIANSSRNAWKDLWIKRPGEKEWTLANDIRIGSRRYSAEELLAELSVY